MARRSIRDALRWLLAALYAIAGIVHLTRPELFVPITPDWVPMPLYVILATGLAEIAGAAGLLTARWRRAAGLGLALYAVCVFPANIKHAVEGVAVGGVTFSWWYHAPRLALQPVLVAWAVWVGGVE